MSTPRTYTRRLETIEALPWDPEQADVTLGWLESHGFTRGTCGDDREKTYFPSNHFLDIRADAASFPLRVAPGNIVFLSGTGTLGVCTDDVLARDYEEVQGAPRPAPPIPLSPHYVDTTHSGMLHAITTTHRDDEGVDVHITVRNLDTDKLGPYGDGVTLHLCDEHAESVARTLLAALNPDDEDDSQ